MEVPAPPNLKAMHVKLRKLREDQEVSQEAMGQLLSISQPQYQRKEAGYAPFSDGECSQLADYFNVTIDDIFEPNLMAHQTLLNKGGDYRTLYNLTGRLMDEVLDMLYYLKQELNQKKKENDKLREQVEALQQKLKRQTG